MPPLIIAALLAGVGIAAAGGGVLVGNVGQSVNDSADATIKLAVAGMIGFVLLKKAKVI